MQNKDLYEECFQILISRVGVNPQFNDPNFVIEQKNYFGVIYELYRQKIKSELMTWLGKQDRELLTFKDWYDDPSTQKQLRQRKQCKIAEQTTDVARVIEVKTGRTHSETKRYLWEYIYQDLDVTGIGISESLLSDLVDQFPEYTSPFRKNLLFYLASDANKPLVVSSFHNYIKLWGIIAETCRRLKGYTHKLVVSPSFTDYKLAPSGVWEPFPDNILENQRELIEVELAPREDKVGFFSINVGDEQFLDREFMRLLKFFARNYKTVVLVDSLIAVPENHWLVRELGYALTMEFVDG